MQLKFRKSSLPVETAIIHCAGVPDKWAQNKTPSQVAATIRRWHVQERGWDDIGYHYIVMPDGTLYPGRPTDRMGAHTYGYNRDTLGVLLIESRKIRSITNFSDYFTEAQRSTVSALLKRHHISFVKGHNDFARTLCPGFKVKMSDFL